MELEVAEFWSVKLVDIEERRVMTGDVGKKSTRSIQRGELWLGITRVPGPD